MHRIDYRLIVAIAIATAVHVYLGLHSTADDTGSPSWPSVQQLIRPA